MSDGPGKWRVVEIRASYRTRRTVWYVLRSGGRDGTDYYQGPSGNRLTPFRTREGAQRKADELNRK